MSVEQKVRKERKEPTEADLARSSEIEKQLKNLREQIKPVNETIAKLEKEHKAIPKPKVAKKVKAKSSLSTTMKLAKTIGGNVAAKKKIPNKSEFFAQCSKIIGLGSPDKVGRAATEKVVKEGLALLEILPADPKKPKAEKKPDESTPSQ